jgi:hypothetical protein
VLGLGMCVLRVSSQTGSFKAFLASSRLPAYATFDKGEIAEKRSGRTYTHYGFKCGVSDREWDDLPGQVQDAIAFLREHEGALRFLLANHPVDDIRLDFPHTVRLSEEIAVQCDYFPPELIRLAGVLGIGLELTLFPPDVGTPRGAKGRRVLDLFTKPEPIAGRNPKPDKKKR